MEECAEMLAGEIKGIKFALASHQEVSKASINECPISHSSQLTNPFLGLPLESGKCESCGTAEPQKCEGHFGFIELPLPIYHPSHVAELKRLLSLLCLKCLKVKNNKFSTKSSGSLEKLLSSCCEETSNITVKDSTNTDGACFIQLKLPSRSKVPDGAWMFLGKYGYQYGEGLSRTLLPSEVLAILKKLPEETKRKLVKKGYFPQEGYILRFLPVPPNCLSIPDVSDGVSVLSMDVASSMLKKVLRQIEIIKSTRSGEPNFESHEVETNELQVAVLQYLQVRGAGTASNEPGNKFGVNKEAGKTATKAWLEKIRTLFISKGSGFSSRTVITGEAYKNVNEVGLPLEIAQRITFEERVNVYNINFLQSLVDNNLCLSYKDGESVYSLREGSKGHTFLRPGQVVHRRIMDGDVVFINRPPTTHKHALQALRIYIHEDHTVKINPLMCGPLAADFDGDCVHLFYPQSLAARAEVLELFSVEKQLLSSHTGNLNLQLATDALLSLKMMFKAYFFGKLSAQQLSMFARNQLPPPALRKGCPSAPYWTALQVIQSTLPAQFNCYGDRHMIRKSEILKIDFNRDAMQSMLNEIVTSIVFEKGPKEALDFFDSLQPLLMENIFSEGFSVGLEDFIIPSSLIEDIQRQIQDISSLLFQLRSSYNEFIERQMDSYLRRLKRPVVTFVHTLSSLGGLIDSKSESAMSKIVQQIGFLGLQLYDRGKFYSRDLVDDMARLFHRKYPYRDEFPCEEYGLVKSAIFNGLDPYEEMVHSIASREVIIRSSRGLAEPGTLFKNLMAILRDVVICYDGTVRNVSSNSVIQFDYGVQGEKSQSLFPAGEPVGVLAATAMSNPAYRAVLDSSASSNSSWDMMKEILFCRVNFKNDLLDRRVILYLNACECGRKFCRENASCVIKNLLKKVSLRDAAVEFLIEYKSPVVSSESYELDNGLVGHIHLSKVLLNDSNISMHDILEKCQDEVNIYKKKKQFAPFFKGILLSVSECCSFCQGSKWSDMPCLKFFWQDNINLDWTSRVMHIMADVICPVLLDAVVKGDPRIAAVNVIWINPDTSTWIGNSSDRLLGELAVEVVLEKKAVKKSGDAWRIVMDCCLPVFHLIDTRRSIPYAVKQIQELIGISCAFDQAVQRLSTSVSMVAKGILKEHLILLASSMTSTGTLIGFNSTGIKAMCRTLGVQVPFTEATLYTPRKCFERAAEKCHLDSLSSIVASCSWGKRVAVGTGARFDLLWNEREATPQKGGIDVYDFLQLVRSTGGEDDDIGCLGVDVDKFDMEDEYMEEGMSPKDSKAVFEDAELELDKSGGWDSSAWDSGNDKQATEGGNGGWETKKSEPETCDAWGSAVGSGAPASSDGWGAAVGSGAPASSDDWGAAVGSGVPASSDDWGAAVGSGAPASSDGWGAANKSGKSTQGDTADEGASGWGSKKNVPETTIAWGSSKEISEPETSVAWGSAVESRPPASSGGWGAPKDSGKSSQGRATDDGASGWGSKKNMPQTSGAWGSSKEISASDWGSGSKGDNDDDASGWASKKNNSENSQETSASGWASKKNKSENSQETSASGWGSGSKGDSDDASGWGSKKNNSDASKEISASGWGSVNKGDNDNASGWGSTKNNSEVSNTWGVSKKLPESSEGWGSANERGKSTATAVSGGWGSKKNTSGTSNSWGSVKESPSPVSSKPWGSVRGSDQSSMGNSPDKGASGWKSGGWNSRKDNTETSKTWGVAKESPTPTTDVGASDWNSKSGSWGSKEKKVENSSTWGSSEQLPPPPTGSQGWGSAHEDNTAPEGFSNWNATDKSQEKSGWGSLQDANNDGEKEASWNAPSKKTNDGDGFGWGSSANENSTSTDSQAWDAKISGNEAKASMETESQWGKPSGSGSSDQWQEAANSQGWGASKSDNGGENVPQSPWGQGGGSTWKKKGPSTPWGSSDNSDWKNKNNRPARPPRPTDGSRNIMFTVTRQRLDLFTAEEQDILAEVEPIMQSIRRIMHKEGYTDGDPIPAEDQSYISDNVLAYHPDKDAKVGGGVDHIMVSKHTSFQDSRCMYVVSVDGQKQDFSYIKCLENLVKTKYPDHAESFIPKYWRKPRKREQEPNNGGGSEQDPNSGAVREQEPNNAGGREQESNNGGGSEQDPNSGGVREQEPNNAGGLEQEPNSAGGCVQEVNNGGDREQEPHNGGGCEQEQ